MEEGEDGWQKHHHVGVGQTQGSSAGVTWVQLCMYILWHILMLKSRLFLVPAFGPRC